MVEKPIQLSCAYPALPAPVHVPLVSLPQHPCPYLAGRVAEDRAIWASSMPPGLYEQFMDAGFRRSGRLIYQPICKGCRECVPIRVPVETFRLDKSQRRCRRRNADLIVSCNPPRYTDEKLRLYQKYVSKWHGRSESDAQSSLESFLYDSPLETTIEFEYRDAGGKLLAVGICDECPNALSSVYFYFDPDHSRRALGTFGTLCEIEFAARGRLPHYYLGYWVDRCGAMGYKRNFKPNEILQSDGVWRVLND